MSSSAAQALQSVKGMRAVLPAQMASYRHVLDRARASLESQGCREIMPNLVESESLYKKTLGVTSDIVLKEMYYVEAGGEQSSVGVGARHVLRPEGTAGVLRSLLADKTQLLGTLSKETLKTWYWGPMFRHERPQTGRLRQFYQLGMEIVGGSKPVTDFGHLLQTDFEAI